VAGSDYKIAVVEYGAIPEVPDSAVVYGSPPGGNRRMPYSFGILEGSGQLCLVDIGIGSSQRQADLVQRQGVQDVTPSDVRLRELGYDPLDVDSVLVTHAHFDHFGNVDAFPNAVFFIQRAELQEWLVLAALPERLRYFSDFVDPASLQACMRLAAEDRLRLVDGDIDNVLPGVHLRAARDTHTPGSMWIEVDGKDGQGSFIFPGDNLFVYENAVGVGGDGRLRPVASAVGSNLNCLLSVDAMLDACERDVSRLLPFHETRLTERFPSRINAAGLAKVEICG
jgi:N-acyl homoserine lactone hydrolase